MNYRAPVRQVDNKRNPDSNAVKQKRQKGPGKLMRGFHEGEEEGFNQGDMSWPTRMWSI